MAGRGLLGFTKRTESEYGALGAAHSSTSISAALGFTVVRDMGRLTGDAVAVICEGALKASMAYEALNNAGAEKRRMFGQRDVHRLVRRCNVDLLVGPLGIHEWLDLYIFETIEEMQQIATEWLWTYSNERPNLGIGGVRPAMKLKMAA